MKGENNMYDYEPDDYEPTEEEYEEMEGSQATEAKFDWKKLMIEFDVENFAIGIAHEVRRTMKEEIVKELKNDFMKELKEDLLNGIRAVSMEIVKDVYENEKVIEGGWGEDKKEYTVRQYILMKIQDTFKDGKFTFRTKDRWGEWKTEEVSLEGYINSQIDFSKFEKEINSNVDRIRKDINGKIKDIFDSSTRQMLSDNVLQILMANDTYQKIQGNIACIADREKETE